MQLDINRKSTEFRLRPVPGGWDNFLTRHTQKTFAWQPWAYVVIPFWVTCVFLFYWLGFPLIKDMDEPFTFIFLQVLACVVSMAIGVCIADHFHPGMAIFLWKCHPYNRDMARRIIASLRQLGFELKSPDEVINLGSRSVYAAHLNEELEKVYDRILNHGGGYTDSALSYANDNAKKLIEAEAAHKQLQLDPYRLDRIQERLVQKK